MEVRLARNRPFRFLSPHFLRRRVDLSGSLEEAPLAGASV